MFYGSTADHINVITFKGGRVGERGREREGEGPRGRDRETHMQKRVCVERDGQSEGERAPLKQRERATEREKE